MWLTQTRYTNVRSGGMMHRRCLFLMLCLAAINSSAVALLGIFSSAASSQSKAKSPLPGLGGLDTGAYLWLAVRKDCTAHSEQCKTGPYCSNATWYCNGGVCSQMLTVSNTRTCTRT